MSTPSSIRFTDDGFNALKALEAATGKSRVAIVSEALVRLFNQTVAQPPFQFQLLKPSEILALQAEVAALEKLHDDDRRKCEKIRTSDKHFAAKTARLLENIDAETAQLQILRLKLGRMGRLPETLQPEDLDSMNSIAAALKKHAEETAPLHARIAELERELDQTRAMLDKETKKAETETTKAKKEISTLAAERDEALKSLNEERQKLPGNAAIDNSKMVSLIQERDEARASLGTARHQLDVKTYELQQHRQKYGSLEQVVDALTDDEMMSIGLLHENFQKAINTQFRDDPIESRPFEVASRIFRTLLP